MTVLVLAAETDRTADGVVTELNDLSVPVMRVDTSWFPQRMSIDAEGCGSSEVSTKGIVTCGFACVLIA